MRAGYFLVFSLLAAPSFSAAGERLFYLELQGVGGYSSAARSAVYHSMSADEPMQKSSAGFDLLQKLTSPFGGQGTLAVQGRLAWDEDASERFEPQLYNAYFRAPVFGAYLWAGHSRAAAGLESYFDTHGALLQALPMYGYGFDRDWGLGASRDFDWGDAAFSVTTGSGMRLAAEGTHLISGRVSKGVLNRDNYAVGAYASAGRIQGTAGYRVTDTAERPYSASGADLALLWDRWELRADLRGGYFRYAGYLAGLGRLGLNLLDENRLKLEVQAVYSGMEKMEEWVLGAGASYAVTPELTFRAMFEDDGVMDDRRVVAQAYYYLPI